MCVKFLYTKSDIDYFTNANSSCHCSGKFEVRIRNGILEPGWKYSPISKDRITNKCILTTFMNPPFCFLDFH